MTTVREKFFECDFRSPRGTVRRAYVRAWDAEGAEDLFRHELADLREPGLIIVREGKHRMLRQTRYDPATAP